MQVTASAAFALLLFALALRSAYHHQLPAQYHSPTIAPRRVAFQRAPWSRPVPAVMATQHTYTLVMGAVCNEGRHDFRQRLRRLYEPHVKSGEFLIRFMISHKRETDDRWRAKELAADGTTDAVEDVLFVKCARQATMLETVDCPGHKAGTKRCFSSRTPYHEAHCAHKTMRWWRLAHQWPSKWYGKTDDDAVIDLPPLLSLLENVLAPIPGPVFGGIVHYSSINLTNLEGVCFAHGANAAIGRKARQCPGAGVGGPYPYVEGPLEILSPEVMRFLHDRAEVDPRQRCHYEDLYVGAAIAQHPALSLVNLDTMLGRKDIYEPGRREYVGADSMLAHWVRSEEAFARVERDFERNRRTRSEQSSALRCYDWAETFPKLLEGFPCCHHWRVCEPVTPLLRQRASLYLNASSDRS